MAQIFSAERAAPAMAPRSRASTQDRAPTRQEDHLAALQRRADGGPVVQRLAHFRNLADGGAVQRAALEDEEPLQGRFAPATGAMQRQADEDEALQAKPARAGGLPAQIQHTMQMMSGVNLGDVNVHYNSPQPAQVGAHAFAQGRDIHVATGQEGNLAHEAWHIAQQRQGRVAPTRMLGEVAINDDPALEAEADQMAARANSTTF